jgi:hypothetical protein
LKKVGDGQDVRPLSGPLPSLVGGARDVVVLAALGQVARVELVAKAAVECILADAEVAKHIALALMHGLVGLPVHGVAGAAVDAIGMVSKGREHKGLQVGLRLAQP